MQPPFANCRTNLVSRQHNSHLRCSRTLHGYTTSRRATDSGANTRVGRISSIKRIRVADLTVDYILFCAADVDLAINPNEVSDAKYVSKQELEEMFADPRESGSLLACNRWIVVTDLQKTPLPLGSG